MRPRLINSHKTKLWSRKWLSALRSVLRCYLLALIRWLDVFDSPTPFDRKCSKSGPLPGPHGWLYPEILLSGTISYGNGVWIFPLLRILCAPRLWNRLRMPMKRACPKQKAIKWLGSGPPGFRTIFCTSVDSLWSIIAIFFAFFEYLFFRSANGIKKLSFNLLSGSGRYMCYLPSSVGWEPLRNPLYI